MIYSLRIHQFQVRIIYKPGPDLFITDWLLSHNHTENKDAEIPGMDIKVGTIQTATNIPECMSIPQLQQATAQEQSLTMTKTVHFVGWPEKRKLLM